MSWRRWVCRLRGYHRVQRPRVEKVCDEFFYPKFYVLLKRKCKCGAEAGPELKGELRPGGFVMYEMTWPA